MLEVMKRLAASLLPKAVDVLMGTCEPREDPGPDIEKAMAAHLEEVSNWSSRMQVFGMPAPKNVDCDTFELEIYPEPLRFRSLGSTCPVLRERDLLTDQNCWLILGQPGSGKTTTVQRIVRRLLTSPESSNDVYQYPIVVRLRDLDTSPSLCWHIAQIIVGLPVKELVRSNSPTGLPIIDHVVGGRPLDQALSSWLSLTRAVLLLDGLDEVPPARRESVDKEIATLAQRASSAKLLLTCRSGEYWRSIEGFSVCEIAPLTSDLITKIVDSWLPEPALFLDQLTRCPYRDVIDRPLLLCHLLLIYRRYGQLPEQPRELYRRVISLLLEKWDQERGVKRASRYSEFDSHRKLEFLAAMAHELTYKMRRNVFSEEDLEKAYSSIHELFRLPSDEAQEVAREVESHSGIIAQGPGGKYEFSHLSLQEYLTAHYLVRDPFSAFRLQYLGDCPGPMAIAVCLAANPSTWFAHCVLGGGLNIWHASKGSVVAFLERVKLERPYFRRSGDLGMALFGLFFEYREDERIVAILEGFLESEEVRLSMSDASFWYRWQDEASDPVRMVKRGGFVSEVAVAAVEDGYVPRRVLSRVIAGPRS